MKQTTSIRISDKIDAIEYEGKIIGRIQYMTARRRYGVAIGARPYASKAERLGSSSRDALESFLVDQAINLMPSQFAQLADASYSRSAYGLGMHNAGGIR